MSLDRGSARFAETLINDPRRGSAAIRVEVPLGARVGTGRAVLGGGRDGLTTLAPEHLLGEPGVPDRAWGLAAVDQVDEVAILAVPDAVRRPPAVGAPPPAGETPPQWSADATELMHTALLERSAARRGFAVLDVPGQDLPPDAAVAWSDRLRQRSSATAFGCLGYPWIVVVDPRGPGRGTVAVPVAGHLAGIMARTDRSVGVHKAPANETVTGAVDTAQPVPADVHDRLNDLGISAVVTRPGRGIRVMGARTLSLDPAWRFTNVRRLVSMIEASLESALGWLVFEPHSRELTGVVEREVRAFLGSLYDRGALDGARPEQAFAVRCDDSTTTAQDVDAGRLTCLVELRPPTPAEIVVVRLAVTEGGVQVSGEQGRRITSATGVTDAR
jgi:phage tail sheath protein FI